MKVLKLCGCCVSCLVYDNVWHHRRSVCRIKTGMLCPYHSCLCYTGGSASMLTRPQVGRRQLDAIQGHHNEP